MFWRRRQRLDEEIDFHVAKETADNIAKGMGVREAQDSALRTFGNVAVAKEKARELDPLYWLDTLWQDTRFAIRLIARNYWLSIAIVGTLTIGIALNLSVFTLLNGLLLRPWVRSEPETFVSIIPRFSGTYRVQFSDYASMSQPDYVWYRDSAQSLKSLAAYRVLPITMASAESGNIRAGLISCNFFDAIQPGPPVLGRYLTRDECGEAVPRTGAIVSEGLWRRSFGADASVIGRVILLNRVPFTVIGVAPAVMLPGPNAGPNREIDAWLPYTTLGVLQPNDNYFSDLRAQWLALAGRRAPGVSLAQVQQELNLLTHAADERIPGRTTKLLVTDGSLVQDPEMRSKAPIIFAVTLGFTTLLLLLASVNVTTLLLSRSAARQQEIAVRLSMGAGRFRLLRQLITESLVLSGISALFSILITAYAPGALWKSLMSSPAPFPVETDWRVLAYAIGVTVVAALIAGLSPAAESLRAPLSESLKGSGTAITPGRRASRVRSGLVAVQVAVSLFLLVYTSLVMKAQRKFYSYDPGFETEHVLNVTLASVLSGLEPSASFYRELESRVRAVPGVRTTSFASGAPWMGRTSVDVSVIDGKPIPAVHDNRPDATLRFVSPEYLQTLDIRLKVGRTFQTGEGASQQLIPAVISEAMAHRYWPGHDPVGHHFGSSPTYEVVGVCRDVQSVAYMQDDGPLYYSLLDERRTRPAFMLVRVDGATQSVAAAIRSILRELDPQMGTTVETLAAIAERQGESLKPAMIFSAVSGALALFLSLTGVYGTVTYSVSQRVREIGIRIALGAERRDVISLVLRSGAPPVCGGIVVGLGLTFIASAAARAVLFGLNPRDPLALSVPTFLMLLASVGAVLIPARRAARHDPLSSLRNE